MGPYPSKKQVHHHYYSNQFPQQYNTQKKSNNFEGPQASNPTSNFKPVNKAQGIPVFQHNLGKSIPIEIINNQPKKDQDLEKQKDYLQRNQNKGKEESFQKKMENQKIQNLQKLIQEYEAGIEKAKQYGRKMQDVAKYEEFKILSLDVFIKNLKQMGLQDNDISSDGICRKIVVGKISSGKSSLLNNLLGTSLDTGMGETTDEVSLVYNSGNIQIFDTPGQNEQFNTQNIEKIKLIASVNEAFILYPDSLKNSEHLVRVITAIKPKHTYLIRTHCDKTNKKDNKTLEEEIITDYQILEKWNIQGVHIFATSAKQKDLFQNGEVCKLLLRQPGKKL